MLWALFTIAFYGFFHTSELIPSLCWSTITLSSTQMSITLLQSKTDPFHRGSTIHLFPPGSLVQYVNARFKYCPWTHLPHFTPQALDWCPSMMAAGEPYATCQLLTAPASITLLILNYSLLPNVQWMTHMLLLIP